MEKFIESPVASGFERVELLGIGSGRGLRPLGLRFDYRFLWVLNPFFAKGRLCFFGGEGCS